KDAGNPHAARFDEILRAKRAEQAKEAALLMAIQETDRLIAQGQARAALEALKPHAASPDTRFRAALRKCEEALLAAERKTSYARGRAEASELRANNDLAGTVRRIRALQKEFPSDSESAEILTLSEAALRISELENAGSFGEAT